MKKKVLFVAFVLLVGAGFTSCGNSGASLEKIALKHYLEKFNGEQEPPKNVYNREETIKYYKQKAKDYHATLGEYESYEVTRRDTLENGNTIRLNMKFKHSKTVNPETFTFSKDKNNKWEIKR